MLYGYEWLPNGNLAITDNNQFIEYNPIAKSLVYTHVFDPKAENITRSVTGNFAYTIDNRLYVLTKEGKQYSVSGDRRNRVRTNRFA
jgi:hypothetical protein